MTYVVTQHCKNCKYTDCVEVCPVEAFHESEGMVYINPEVCIDCDICVSQCPVEAIYPEDQVPEKWNDYIKLNAEECGKYPTIFEKKEPLATAKTLDELLNKEKQQ